MAVMLKVCKKFEYKRMLKFSTKVGSQALEIILNEACSFDIKKEDFPLYVYKYMERDREWGKELQKKEWEKVKELQKKEWEKVTELTVQKKEWEVQKKEWEKVTELTVKDLEKVTELTVKDLEKVNELTVKDLKWEFKNGINNLKWKFSHVTQRHVYENFLKVFWSEICLKMPKKEWMKLANEVDGFPKSSQKASVVVLLLLMICSISFLIVHCYF